MMELLNDVHFMIGTQQEYNNLETIDNNTFYVISDAQKIYLGTVEYSSVPFYQNVLSSKFLVKSFPTIDAMTDAFEQGDEYTEVQYGDYVIISSEIENENLTPYQQDNGKVYKRIQESPGYEYIFRITGPPGPPSTLNINTMAEINEYAEDNNLILEEHSASLATEDLVPGKNTDGTYNDEIVWKYYQTEQSGQLKTYMGVQIPYPTIEFNSEYADIIQPQIIDNDAGNKVHPFHSNFTLQIPKIPYGRSVDGLYLINSANATQVDFGDLDSNTIDNYLNNNIPILIYKISEYDSGNELTSSYKFLTEFKPIYNIDITNEGYLKFYLTEDNTDINNNSEIVYSSTPIIPTLTGAEIEQDGTLNLTWNNPINNSTFSTPTTGTKLPVTTNSNFDIENLITDLIIYDSILYKRYIGLDQQIVTITNIAADHLSTENDAAINTLAGTTNTYHKDTTSNLWYKKLFDIRTLLNNQSQNNGT